jgi:hypothetical protein
MYAKNDHLCGFSDIKNYQMILAHENPTFKDSLPLQLKGNGCAIHCISFAVDVMSGHHASLTDAQTEPLRKVLRALLNTSTPFGTTRSYKQEWEARDQSARIAAREFLDEMEIDICSSTHSNPSDHSEDKTQSVTQTRRPDQSAGLQSISAETPMEELNKDDGMEIDVYSQDPASSRDMAEKPPCRVGISLVDDSGPEWKVISNESISQEESSDGIEEQENSNASHQVQITSPSTQTVNPRTGEAFEDVDMDIVAHSEDSSSSKSEKTPSQACSSSQAGRPGPKQEDTSQPSPQESDEEPSQSRKRKKGAKRWERRKKWAQAPK